MDGKLNSKLNTKENTEDRKAVETVVKITISKESEQRLADVLERVNDGFEAGKVNRQDLASWVIRRFAEECDADIIKAIRQEYFDEFAFLEGILKRSKETGKLPPELRNALKQHLGVEAPSRKGKKNLTANYINDVNMESDETKATE
jgi:hypothetical protein